MKPTEIIESINAFMSVYQFLKDMKRSWHHFDKVRLKLFGKEKGTRSEDKFKEALIGTKNAIEYYIWYGKGFAIEGQCGPKTDSNFHFLIGRVINAFNDIYMRLNPEKLDEKLIDHLIGQLKQLEESAKQFWNIQGISSHQNKEGDALKIIENFEGKLRDFQGSMSKYLKSEQQEHVV